MRCKKCQEELTHRNLLVLFYNNGVTFTLKCECGYYYESQISGSSTMYNKANGSADSRVEDVKH